VPASETLHTLALSVDTARQVHVHVDAGDDRLSEMQHFVISAGLPSLSSTGLTFIAIYMFNFTVHG